MILAVPSHHRVPFNHFAKAPSFSVIDSNTQQLQAEFHLELDPSKSCSKSQRFCISSATIKSRQLRFAKSDNPCCKPCLTQGSASMIYLGNCFNGSGINTVTANHGFKLWQSLTK